MEPFQFESIHSQQLRFKAGRQLGFGQFGAPDGWPVFYFHGFPGSRLEAGLIDQEAAQIGVRIIAVDRPGYGLSDHDPCRTLGGWANDVRLLADNLGCQHFGILGVSGGAPYALACAALLPGRVTAAACVGGIGPLAPAAELQGMSRQRRLGGRLLGYLPWLITPAYRRMAKLIREDVEAVLNEIINQSSAPDKLALQKAEVREILSQSLAEGVRQQPGGGGRDLRLYLSPWDISLGTIEIPVTLWHGELDQTVPASMSQRLGSRIRNASVQIVPGEGHYSLPINHAKSILLGLRNGGKMIVASP